MPWLFSSRLIALRFSQQHYSILSSEQEFRLPTQSDNVALYFAFPDGVYDYVCAECTALCCKGHGFGGNLEREMRPLFERYPQLESMALGRTGDQITFATTADGCIMLDTDNFCRIEKELGKDKKPNLCNLFPFNSFAKIGRTVTVSPHFLCPLRAVLPARPGEVQGSHSLVEASIRKSQILDQAYLKAVVKPLRIHPALSEAATISMEEQFRDLCSEALGKYSFREVLNQAAKDAKSLEAFAARAARIMGLKAVKNSKQRDHLDDLLLAFAPVYRLGMLSLGPEAILRALAVAEFTLRRVWSDATKQPGLQGVANSVAQFAATQMLLAHGDEPFDFGKISQKTFSFYGPEIIFAAFYAVRQANGPSGVLGALEQAMQPSMLIADRSVLLLQLGNQMELIKSRKKRKHAEIIDKILSQ